MSPATPESLIWGEWKKITRFFESSRIAFRREDLLCSSLEQVAEQPVVIKTVSGPSTYRILLTDHLKAIRDDAILFSIVLTASYGLAESFARIKLGLSDDENLGGGVEAWGHKLLQRTGHGWSDALDGLAGAVEVAAIRNALAHGVKTVNESLINRFVAQGLTCPWSIGSKIVLDYQTVEQYRSRLKSIMRFANNTKRARGPTVTPRGPRTQPRKRKNRPPAT
jgi:hypothetical protein